MIGSYAKKLSHTQIFALGGSILDKSGIQAICYLYSANNTASYQILRENVNICGNFSPKN